MNQPTPCSFLTPSPHADAPEIVHSSEFSTLDSFCEAIFIPKKQWFVAGSTNGYIKVYNYETMQEVKTFRAHVGYITSLDVHASEPYMLSAARFDQTVKLWNWEKGWECVRTIYTAASRVKFNPKDADYFACTTPDGFETWNISSPGSDNLPLSTKTSEAWGLDYLTHGDELCVITGHHSGLVKIWNWQCRSCLRTLQGHTGFVATVCTHPDLPLLITGSYDGTVRLWNKNTFE
ncbi:hypothetical protein EJB05_01397, partial [Eragrostis curvula]